MGRNNERNIKAHNDKLHKAQDKAKAKKKAREEKLKEIARKFNENKDSESREKTGTCSQFSEAHPI